MATKKPHYFGVSLGPQTTNIKIFASNVETCELIKAGKGDVGNYKSKLLNLEKKVYIQYI